MTWEQCSKQYLRYLKLERGLSDNTVEAYLRDVSKLSSWAIENEIQPKAVHLETLRQFLKAQSNLSARSQARLITSIKGLFQYLVYDKCLESDPTSLLDSPRIGQHLPDFLTHEEVEKMLMAIDRSTPEGERNHTIIEVLYACGMRVSELINLRLSDIFPKEGFLRVIGKGDKERLVPIHDEALRRLEIYIRQIRSHIDTLPGESDIVFLSKRGKRMGRSTVFTFIQQTAEKAGINKSIGPHTFRHSFATVLVNHGADLRVVQQLLGHESITTTEVYTHLNDNELRKAIQKHPRNKR